MKVLLGRKTLRSDEPKKEKTSLLEIFDRKKDYN